MMTKEATVGSGILIVGAGLAGLTLALILAKDGILSTVVEKQERITPSRWAILLYPFGMKIFDELSVLDDLTAMGLRLKPPEMRTSKGESLAVVDTGSLTEPRLNYSLLLGPSEIRKVLREKAISLGVELLEGYNFRDTIRDKVSGKITGARVEREGGEVLQVQTKVVVGADGYKSRVRELLGVRTRERKYPVVTAFFIDYEHGLDHMTMILGKGSQMVVLPCTRNRLNLGYTENGLSLDRLERLGGLDYVKGRMSEAAPHLRAAIHKEKADSTGDTPLFIEPSVIHVDAWVVEGGILIGDAAHSFHPGTGSGAQAAFMDAALLAPILARCVRDDDFSLPRLRKYEVERRPLVNFQESTNNRTMSMELAKNMFGIWLRNRSLRAVGKLINQREYQEIITGVRVPTRFETFKLMSATFLP